MANFLIKNRILVLLNLLLGLYRTCVLNEISKGSGVAGEGPVFSLSLPGVIGIRPTSVEGRFPLAVPLELCESCLMLSILNKQCGVKYMYLECNLLVGVYKTSGAYNGNSLGLYTMVITLESYRGGVISVT